MSEGKHDARPILIHYHASPYAEKARRLLAFKGVAYGSHVVKGYEPRPSLQALTGGYRRIPVLASGRDVYCDTRLIARFLDSLSKGNANDKPICTPEPAKELSFSEQDLFGVIVALRVPKLFASMTPEDAKAFGADRALFSKASKTKFVDMSTTNEQKEEKIRGYLSELEEVLDSNDHGTLSGHADFKEVDFAVYHSIWFPFNNDVKDLGDFPLVDKWMARMRSLGAEKPEDVSDAKLFQSVRESADGAARLLGENASPPGEFEIGSEVSVQPTDYGIFPTTGKLVAVTDVEFVVERSDDTVGTVFVHFPRTGFELVKPAQAKY